MPALTKTITTDDGEDLTLERVTDDLLLAAQAGRGTLRVDVRTNVLAPLLRDVVQDVAGAQPVAA